MKPTDIGNPDYFHKVVDCQWACPAHTPVPEYIRLIAAGRYGDAYLVNWKSNVFPGILGRTCDRPCEPACRRGRVEDGQSKRAGRDLPAEARRGRLQGRHPRPAAEAGDPEERQARRVHRRRPGVSHGRARSRAARLRSRRLRRRFARRRHDPQPDPEVPAPRGNHRRRGRLHPRPRRRVPRRRVRVLAQAAPRREVRRGVRRLRRAARARSRHPGPQGSGGQHPHRHRLARERVVRPHHEDRQARDRARRRQHRDGLLPVVEAPRRRRRQGDRPLRVRGDEGEPVGEGGRDARGHPDPQLPRAEGVHARQREAHRRHLREGAGGLRRQGPPAAAPDQRARPALRVRRRPGGGRPGERVPVDRARHRTRVRPATACPSSTR